MPSLSLDVIRAFMVKTILERSRLDSFVKNVVFIKFLTYFIFRNYGLRIPV